MYSYGIKSWAYGGIDPTIPGNGGEHCANFINLPQKLLETLIALTYCYYLIRWGYKNLAVPEASPYVRADRGGKRLLLIIMCLTFGIEIGFKFATQSAIYLFNPCHVTTAIQVRDKHNLDTQVHYSLIIITD